MNIKCMVFSVFRLLENFVDIISEDMIWIQDIVENNRKNGSFSNLTQKWRMIIRNKSGGGVILMHSCGRGQAKRMRRRCWQIGRLAWVVVVVRRTRCGGIGRAEKEDHQRRRFQGLERKWSHVWWVGMRNEFQGLERIRDQLPKINDVAQEVIDIR